MIARLVPLFFVLASCHRTFEPGVEFVPYGDAAVTLYYAGAPVNDQGDLVVTGNASVGDGPPIATLEIHGITATPTEPGFSSWTAIIPGSSVEAAVDTDGFAELCPAIILIDGTLLTGPDALLCLAVDRSDPPPP